MADQYPSTEEVLEDQGTEESPQPDVSTEENTEVEGAPVGEVADQAQTQATDWDGTQFALKFRGREIVPESRDKLLNWAQLGYTYSGKENTLKEREEALTKRQQSVEQYEQLAQAFQSNPRLQQQIMDMYYQSHAGGQPNEQGNQFAELPPEMAQKFTEMQTRMETYESERANEALDKEVDEIKGKYGNYDWDTPDTQGQTLVHEVLKTSQELGGVPLEVAFRHVMWDQAQENAKAEALKANTAAKAQQATKGKAVPTPTPAPAKPSQPDTSNMSYDEIAQAVIAGDLR